MVPKVNGNDDVTADKYIVLYEALQVDFYNFFKKAKSNNIRTQQTHELKKKKVIFITKCPTKCETFPETGRFTGSSSDIISSMMLSACNTEQAFIHRSPELKVNLSFFQNFYLGELYPQTTADCAKFLLAGD